MAIDPQPAAFQPDAAILSLGDRFYDPVEPARFPETTLRFRNDRAAAQVGLADIDDAEWTRRFGRFEPFEGSLPQPLALRYHGHQFRSYNPDLGDGRGFLYAQCRDGAGRLMDFGTKGSGQTPWSRFGDGRLTLKGGVREILATEMLEALGVETSRSLSLIETGEALQRGDEPSPTRSAVLTRLSWGHIRIGSFQRLAFLNEDDALDRLARYALSELYGEEPGDAPALHLYRRAVPRTARLAASYMAAGFVHGVLNTDNIAITAESFDYGPWRFAPVWDPGFTAAYFDHQGLYAFARQPQAIHWNVAQLAIALSRIVPVDDLAPILDTFPALYEAALTERLLWRLGIMPQGEERDLALVAALETALAERSVPIDRLFFDWRGGCRRGASPVDPLYRAAPFEALAAALDGYVPRAGATDHPYWSDPEPCSMLIEEVEAIWAAIDTADDWSPLHAKVAAIRRMGAALAA
jgi:uncharacterized protein YdiU (UPF0061 family)